MPLSFHLYLTSAYGKDAAALFPKNWSHQSLKELNSEQLHLLCRYHSRNFTCFEIPKFTRPSYDFKQDVWKHYLHKSTGSIYKFIKESNMWNELKAKHQVTAACATDSKEGCATVGASGAVDCE